MAIQKLRNLPISRTFPKSRGHELSQYAVDHDGQSEVIPLESARWAHFPDVAHEDIWKTCSPYFSVIQWWLPEVEGCSIGCHEFVMRLGGGAYGQVYASAGADGSLTAVKVMSKGAILSSEDFQAVTNECNFLSQLNHPNICALKGTINGVKNFYIFMECAGSTTLHAILYKTGPLDLSRTQHMFRAIMEGVDHMHSRGVAHCDLKPGNIVISDEGTPKIVDFGLALKVGEQTVVGPRGTFPFIAPEALLEPWNVYDLVKGDMWALGVILLEMISGVDKVSRMLGWVQRAPLSRPRVMQLVSFVNTPKALEHAIAPELGLVAARFASVLLALMHCVPEQRLDTKTARLMLLEQWR